MLPLLGMILVFCAVAGGFALENGQFAALIQPSELAILCGGSVGILLIANPLKVLYQTAAALVGVFRSPPATRRHYVSSLVMLHALFEFARRHGVSRLEDQLDDPAHSVVFRRHADTVRNAGVLTFICDTLRITTMAKIAPYDLYVMLEHDLENRRLTLAGPAKTLASLADALPGLGILSAVLGVIVTMGSLTDSPQAIGRNVGGALIGTFLGIFVSYGFVAPLSARLAWFNHAEMQYYQTLRYSLAAFASGMPPSMAVEFGRRSIPPTLRPDFAEMEVAWKKASRWHPAETTDPIGTPHSGEKLSLATY